jgi:cysteine synthase
MANLLCIGPTPLVELTPLGDKLYGKLEYVHPTRSAKFRALVPHLIGVAESGELKRAERVVIRSAGCAAITTAWICRKLQLPVETVIPDHAGDVTAMLQSLGAVVWRLQPQQAANHMAEAESDPRAYVVDQFGDPRLIDRYRPMAREILDELPNAAAIVVGIGTAASIMGVAHEVHARRTSCRVIGVWPEEFDATWRTPYTEHGITGLAPPVRETHLRRDQVDAILRVSTDAALTRAGEVFQRTGLPVGPSSGATLEAAIQLRHEGLQGPIACIFASTFDCNLPECSQDLLTVETVTESG